MLHSDGVPFSSVALEPEVGSDRVDEAVLIAGSGSTKRIPRTSPPSSTSEPKMDSSTKAELFKVINASLVSGQLQTDALRAFVEAHPTSIAAQLVLATFLRAEGDENAANLAIEKARELKKEGVDAEAAPFVPTQEEWNELTQPTDAFSEVIPGKIWTIIAYYPGGDWNGNARFVTTGNLVRLQDGSLALVGAIPLSREICDKIRSLGNLEYCIVQTAGHGRYAPDVKSLFPDIKIVGINAHAAFRPTMPRDETLPEHGTWKEEFECTTTAGSMLSENILVHKPTKSAFVTDMAFACTKDDPWYHRFYGYLQDMPMGRPSGQATHNHWTQDREAMRESVSKVMEMEWDKLFLGHGRPVLKDGKEALRTAFADWGLVL